MSFISCAAPRRKRRESTCRFRPLRFERRRARKTGRALPDSLDLEKRRPARSEILVTTDGVRWTTTPELQIDAALEFLRQPFAVFVENNRSDRDFVMAVADTAQKKALAKALKHKWMHFVKGGGLEEMHQDLLEMGRRPDRVGQHLGATGDRRGELRRSSWIFDSDALAPGKPSPSSNKLKKLCDKKGVFHHQLERRMAESYIPIPALRTVWTNIKDHQARKKKVRAFEKLEPIQQHHFNMKSGFDGDRRLIKEYSRTARDRTIAQETQSLFDIPENVRRPLATGFKEILPLFRNPEVLQNDQWFEEGGAQPEMRIFIDKLLDQI